MRATSLQEPEKRPDYEQQVQKELDRIQQRILLLNEMLNNAKPKERFVEGDAFDVSLWRPGRDCGMSGSSGSD
jgi:ADP-ribosylation factor-binding protein GGA